jgi:hypothetical protein
MAEELVMVASRTVKFIAKYKCRNCNETYTRTFTVAHNFSERDAKQIDVLIDWHECKDTPLGAITKGAADLQCSVHTID